MKKIIVLIGGDSNEHEVSIISGKTIFKNLDDKKYLKKLIYLDKKNIPWYIDMEDFLKDSNSIGYIPKKIENISDSYLKILKSSDIVFPVIHGNYGEDGKIQKFFEKENIKYIGCDSISSNLCFDKFLTKNALRNKNINMAEDIETKKKDFLEKGIIYLEKLIKEKLDYPIYLKPARSGSSVGVYRVESFKELEEKLNLSFEVDEKVLIEKEINGFEVEVAILQKDNEFIVSDLGIIIPDSTFYTYDSKYNSKESKTAIIKSSEDIFNLPKDFIKKVLIEDKEKIEETKDKEKIKERINKNINIIKEKALEIFKTLKCKDLSRIDFFLCEDGYVFNEINTMPGFTSISMYPKLIKEKVGSFSKILDILIENNLKE